MIREFFLVFVPLFVAMDAIGILPLYLGLTTGVEAQKRRRIVWEAFLTALVVAFFFILLGKTIFRLMGITISDFMVAGGVLLFLIATADLLSGHKVAREVETLGVVPLGVPLVVGPAVLTTGLMLADVHGLWITALAVLVNLVITMGVFLTAGFWYRLLGEAGSKALSKVASLILAAIAVMMVRRGLVEIVEGILQGQVS